MDYNVHVVGMGHVEEYPTKAEGTHEALLAALKLFQQEHGKRCAEEYDLCDSNGRLIAKGPVSY
ncbi:MAG: hypothetical protein ACLPWF_12520 [Bryobacteraceae bacterium]